jgi:hypothetical protein
MVELVDTSDLKSDDRKVVRVQFPLRVQKTKEPPHKAAFFMPAKKTEHKAKRLRKGKIKLPSLLEEIDRSTVEERRQSLQGSVFEEESNRKNLPLSFLGVLLIY